MFSQYTETPHPEPEPTPTKGLVELFRTKSAGELLFIGVTPLAACLYLQALVASQTLTCRTSATTSCVVTNRVLGLVPIGREEIADVRGARTGRTAGTRRGPGDYLYYVTLDTGAGEHRMKSTKSFDAAYAMAHAINEAIRTRTPAFEASVGFVVIDALVRLIVLFVTFVAAGFTFFGVYRLVRPPC